MNKLIEVKPLVINITNQVTINDIANILTMINASPIMSNDIIEVEDLMQLAKLQHGVLIINIGTLNQVQAQQMLSAVSTANKLKIPVVLDPVGAGASKFRTNFCLKLLNEYKITIVRGNYGEITCLNGSEIVSKGVDSEVGFSSHIAEQFAKKYQTVVLASGKVDYISDGKETKIITGGSAWLPKITGTGCMLSAIIGAYASYYQPIVACEKGLNLILQASENAHDVSETIIDFKINLFREISRITNAD